MISEFYERTGVNLTGEEYKQVEDIYNSVQMDKDEFCELWMKNRDNKIIAELMNTIKKLEEDCNELKSSNDRLLIDMGGVKAETERQLQQIGNTHKEHMESLGRKMIEHFEDDAYRYDDLCEEFGLDNICKWKLELDIELGREEREHLIKKL